MRRYEVFRGTAHYAWLDVQDDGQYRWTVSPGWQARPHEPEDRAWIEHVVQHSPAARLLVLGPFIVQHRASAPDAL